MKTLILGALAFLSTTAFAYEAYQEQENEQAYRPEHEMFLACVPSKKACRVMAKQEGYAYLKALKDPARCASPTAYACIVKH
ncbi:MAG TPA: hypothetical protein VNJ08_06915 [Bacteriovoracaceae bacterium]|nr:hypothetical protein [Bacteriovoracaceae bacterium]